MGILQISEAIIKLGLPALLLSWMIFHWLFSEGEINREVKHKALKTHLRGRRKPFKNSD